MADSEIQTKKGIKDMAKTIEEIRAELQETKIDGYVIPEGNDAFARLRLKAIKFCHKLFKKNPKAFPSMMIADLASLHAEFKKNGDFSYIVIDTFDVGFYRGYMFAKAELEGKKEQ